MADEEIVLCGAVVDKINRLFRWLAELRIEGLVFGMPLAAVDGDRFQRVFDFRLRRGILRRSSTEKSRKPKQHHSGIGSIQSHLEICLLGPWIVVAVLPIWRLGHTRRYTPELLQSKRLLE